MDLRSLLKKLFIIMIFFSCFTCYSRADYNLPLFAFAYLLWDVEKPVFTFISLIKIISYFFVKPLNLKYSQKTRLTYLFIFSWIIDLTWLIYWGPFWDSAVFDENWAQGVQTFVLVLSIINYLIKVKIYFNVN